MEKFQVLIVHKGKPSEKEYQKVDAETPKDAAEKLTGGPVFEIGSASSLRAIVRRPGHQGDPIQFYERPFNE